MPITWKENHVPKLCRLSLFLKRGSGITDTFWDLSI